MTSEQNFENTIPPLLRSAQLCSKIISELDNASLKDKTLRSLRQWAISLDAEIHYELEQRKPKKTLIKSFDGFTVRVSNTLIEGGYIYVEDVLAAKDSDLLKIQNFGPQSLISIQQLRLEK